MPRRRSLLEACPREHGQVAVLLRCNLIAEKDLEAAAKAMQLAAEQMVSKQARAPPS